MKKIAFILLTSMILQSCDCIQQVSGTVVDKDTGKPISDVTVHKYGSDSYNATTNGKGEFEISCISGGLFRCPPMKIVIEKNGYEIIEIKGGGKIELKKLK